MHNEEFHNLYSSPIILKIKEDEVARNVARLGEKYIRTLTQKP
jgi:hypothetical protein